MSVVVASAGAHEVGDVLRLIRELAAYERKPDAVHATEASLSAALWGPGAVAHALLARDGGAAVGLALWFLNYSTWTGVPGLYLEDLFVAPEARGRGVGRALFAALGREARARGCARIDFAVLDWNADAMAFYRRIGALPCTGWQPWRVDAAGIARLADG